MEKPILARLQHLMTLKQEVEALGWWPAVDWQDKDTSIVLILDAPGVDPDSLDLTEEGNEVVISGYRPQPERLLSNERPYGAFSRRVCFPEEVIPQSGKAQLISGVLEISFEKKHPTISVEQ